MVLEQLMFYNNPPFYIHQNYNIGPSDYDTEVKEFQVHILCTNDVYATEYGWISHSWIELMEL